MDWLMKGGVMCSVVQMRKYFNTGIFEGIVRLLKVKNIIFGALELSENNLKTDIIAVKKNLRIFE